MLSVVARNVRVWATWRSVVDELLAVDPRELPAVALGEEIVEISRQLTR